MIKYISKQLNNNSLFNAPITLAIGNFNGLHIGHQLLIKHAYEMSKNNKTLLVVLTFIHPLQKQILSQEQLERKLCDFGVDFLFQIEFTDEFKKVTKNSFIQFLKKINVQNIVIGEDFRFGYLKEGTTMDLKKNFHTLIVPLLKINNQKVSTSSIKQLLANGKLEEANMLLGYEYEIEGIVKKGLQNGRKLGFPTINLSLDNYVIPSYGVYASHVNIDNKTYLAMSYIGKHKTIDSLDYAILETNIFNFKGNLYDKIVKVSLIKQIAIDNKFSTIDELKDALRKYQIMIQKAFN